jgi:predicted O-methyltransferase YrrM
MPVFISYSSIDAVLLKNTLNSALKLHNVDSWTDKGIANGEKITEKLYAMIQKCEICILLATRNSLASQWCQMEMAAFWSAGKQVLIFSPDASLTRKDLPTYLEDVNFQGTAEDIALAAKNEIDKRGSIELIKATTELKEKLDPSLFYNTPNFVESLAIQQVTLKYFESTAQNIDQLKSKVSHLSVPATQYPDYLIALQQHPKARVKAIAIVDDIESFWDNETGDRILDTSTPTNTQRVFTFKNQTDFIRLKRTIKDHCEKYKVRLISTLNAPSNRENIHDFSLIWFSNEDVSSFNNSDEPPAGTILAYYREINGSNEIEFSSDSLKVKNYWRWFKDIYQTAVKPEVAPDGTSDLIRTQKQVFGLDQKEMSHYIPEVEKYDQCEQLHPYFADMRKTMIQSLLDWKQESPKILESGAGTGILTDEILRILSGQKNPGKLLSMEYDNEYFDYLSEKMKNYPDFVSIHKDAKVYDPPGKFDLIFSSFADHHIVRNDEDAQKYYTNIKRNLFKGSVFIVGDEFLRDHDRNDFGDRIHAIQEYHQHIIEQSKIDRQKMGANKDLYDGLVQLETEAMNSGVRGVQDPSSPRSGDFKVSIAHFKERIERAGLRIIEITPIGPKNESVRKSVGGIYVIQVGLPQ